MPIDPSIVPTALKGFNTPFERLNKQMEAEQTRSLNAARDAETAKLTRAAAEQEALQRILQESGGDLSDATLNKITQVAPALGVKFRGDLFENRKKLADATKAEMESKAKQTEWGRSLLLAAKANPAMWPQIRAMAISGGGDIGTLVQGTPQFDPAVVDALLQTGLQAKDHIEQNLALMEAFRKGDMRYAVGAIAKILPSLDPDEANELAQAALFSGMPKPMLDAVLKDPQAFAQTETERQEGADRDATREQQARLAASDDARMAATAAETARHNRVTESQGAQRVAIAAQRAASGAGQTGTKSVISGDANRIAGLNSAIQQAQDLSRNAGSSTGTVAWAETYIPEIVTQYTGLGAEAKARQAMIDLQKQIIGKELEGGVLRKEDEVKYAKILMKISDPPSVAQQKMAGLVEALRIKRESTLEALDDAGYNTDAFRARQQNERQQTERTGVPRRRFDRTGKEIK